MKNTLSILLILFTLNTFGQEINSKRTILSEQSIVRGEDGMVYPYKMWKQLMASSKYALKNRETLTDGGLPEYMIVELKGKDLSTYFEKMPKPTLSEAFSIDQTFNGLKVSDVNGKKYDLKNLNGKTLVLNFWFIAGDASKTLMPALNDIYELYKNNKDVIFLSFCNNQKQEIEDFLKTTPYKFNIVDDARSLAQRYKVKSYPTTIVVDKNNQIKFSGVGSSPASSYWIKKAIEESLSR